MAKAKKNTPQMDEAVEAPVLEAKDFPEFPGDAKLDYVDINDPEHANLTYVELQKLNSK